MSYAKALEMIADESLSHEEVEAFINTIEDEDERKLANKKLKDKNKPKKKPELPFLQLVELVEEKYGEYISGMDYSAKQVGYKGDKKWEVSIKDLNKNTKIMVSIVDPTLCWSVVDQAAFRINDNGQKVKITPTDVYNIRVAVEDRISLKRTKAEITEAITAVALDHPFNKFYDWLIRLKDNPEYKGVLDNWGPRVFGCKDLPAIHKALRRWILQCVAIAMQPGRYREAMLILINFSGGEGKTAFVRNFPPNPEWVYEGALSIENTQKCAQESAGCMFCDFTDGGGAGKKDQNDLKRFITSNRLTYVPKFENYSVVQETYQSYIMSTNDPTPLTNVDMSVVRRSIPIEFTKLDKNELLKIRDQLFYEAVVELARLDALKKEEDNDCYVLADEDKDEWIQYCEQFSAPSVLKAKLSEYFADGDLKPFYTRDEMLSIAKMLYKYATNDDLKRALEGFGFTYRRKEYMNEVSKKNIYGWVWVSPEPELTNVRVDEAAKQTKEVSTVTDDIDAVVSAMPEVDSNIINIQRQRKLQCQ